MNSGKEIWCGFKNAVRTFDTDRPGRQTSDIQFKQDFPNMIGLVSCIRENPIMPGLVAFGTYSKCIGTHLSVIILQENYYVRYLIILIMSNYI